MKSKFLINWFIVDNAIKRVKYKIKVKRKKFGLKNQVKL